MSVKFICDVCGKERERSLNKFSYLCHIDDVIEGNISNGYVDNDGNRISGRENSVDLCNKCYNEIVFAAVKKMEDMKSGLCKKKQKS